MSTQHAVNLESQLAQHYRQPKGVEQYGIEAVPEQQRTVRWYDLFSIILNFLVNPGTILVGALAVVSGIISFYIPDAMIKTLSTIVITGVLYLATQLILKARVDVLARAAAPIEVPVDEVALDLALIEQ